MLSVFKQNLGGETCDPFGNVPTLKLHLSEVFNGEKVGEMSDTGKKKNSERVSE